MSNIDKLKSQLQEHADKIQKEFTDQRDKALAEATQFATGIAQMDRANQVRLIVRDILQHVTIDEVLTAIKAIDLARHIAFTQNFEVPSSSEALQNAVKLAQQEAEARLIERDITRIIVMIEQAQQK